MDKKTIMDNFVRMGHEKAGFNGTWLFAENGEIVSKGARGYCDPEDSKPVTEDTVFMLASVTKQFTATAVILAVRDGLINLDDDITKYFPEIPYKGVTIRHLMTHTSGIPDYFDDYDWFVRIWKEENRVPGNKDILRFLRETKLKPYFAPGEGIEYSNTGYSLLVEILEKVTGIPFEDFIIQRIFEPAGMASTTSYHSFGGALNGNCARGMVLENGKYLYPEDSESEADEPACYGEKGQGDICSNIFDLLTWDRVLREGKVLTSEEQKLMYTPAKLNNGEIAEFDDVGIGYGFGWAVENNPKLGLIVSHSGGLAGLETWFERLIDADKVLVLLNNRQPKDYRAYLTFYTGMRAIARGEEPEPIMTIEDITIKDPDKSKWESFLGKYEHPKDFELIIDEVYMKDGDLWAKAIDDDGDPMEFKFYPIGENKFGRKGGMLEVTFGENCLMIEDFTCKKL